MKTLVIKVNKVTRDNYEIKEGYDRYCYIDETQRYNEYKENVQYLKNRINKFGYVGAAL